MHLSKLNISHRVFSTLLILVVGLYVSGFTTVVKTCTMVEMKSPACDMCDDNAMDDENNSSPSPSDPVVTSVPCHVQTVVGSLPAETATSTLEYKAPIVHSDVVALILQPTTGVDEQRVFSSHDKQLQGANPLSVDKCVLFATFLI